MSSLVLIEVEDGIITDVHRTEGVSYWVVDWDSFNVGEIGSDPLPPEFEAEWPEIAEAVRQKNADLD